MPITGTPIRTAHSSDRYTYGLKGMPAAIQLAIQALDELLEVSALDLQAEVGDLVSA